MRIGINATSLGDRPSGARQRFLGLYGALFRAQPGKQYLIYEPRDCRVAEWFAGQPNITGVATPLMGAERWQRLVRGVGYWDRRLRADQLDLFETLHLPAVIAPACPTVLTVHDIRAGGSGEPPVARILYLAMLRRSLRRADQVITVSMAMQAELSAIEPRARIKTVYNGLDPSAYRCAQPIEPLLPVTREYLVAVGHFEPRKNYIRLIHAFALLRRANPLLDLVIVGKDGGSLQEARNFVERTGLGEHVRLLHDVDDAQLACLYCGAKMVVFPSTYEGFGIPLIEAMAAGRPLAVSDIPVFRELTQDRGCYFDPLDPASIAASIAALLASPETQKRLVDYGAHRIRDFAFDRLAAGLNSIHEGLLAGAPVND